MAITIHYVNKEWKLISRLLDIVPLENKHSARYLLEVLDRVLERWTIESRVFS